VVKVLLIRREIAGQVMKFIAAASGVLMLLCILLLTAVRCSTASHPYRLPCFSSAPLPPLRFQSRPPVTPLDVATRFRTLSAAARLPPKRELMLHRLRAQRGQQRFAGTFKLSWPSLEASPSVPLRTNTYTTEQEALLDCPITRVFTHTLPLQIPAPLEPLAELGASIPVIGANVRHTILIVELKTPQGPQPRTADSGDVGNGRTYVCIDFMPVSITDPSVIGSILAGVGAEGSVRVRFLRGCPKPPRGCVFLGDARPGNTLRDAVEYGDGWDGTRLKLVNRDCKVFATELANHLL